MKNLASLATRISGEAVDMGNPQEVCVVSNSFLMDWMSGRLILEAAPSHDVLSMTDVRGVHGKPGGHADYKFLLAGDGDNKFFPGVIGITSSFPGVMGMTILSPGVMGIRGLFKGVMGRKVSFFPSRLWCTV